MVPDTFIKEIFNEENGKTSFARIGSFLSLLAGVGWVSYLVYKNHVLPDLSGISLFIGVPYGTNKFTNFIGQFTGKGQ
jgi:hypothetical protein